MSNPARSLLVGLSDLAFDDESHPSPLERITKEQFDDGRARRFGATNPEKMNVPFWNAMVESSSQAWDARVKFLKDKTQVDDNENGSVGSETEEVGDTADRSVELDHDQNGKSEDKEEQAKMTDKGTEPQGSDPDQGQDQNQHQEAEASVSSYWGNPIWCIDRFGHSLTTLPDGTHVQIGGEHEDWYDPDFLIYNDVIVHHATSTPENPQYDIYGYPEDVFRPTDFHSATFVPALEAIFIIGCNGYETPDTKGVQERGETPIYKLSMGSWKMEKVDTKGKGPGWIWRHDARLVGNTIRIKDNENGQAGDYSRAKKYVMENGERKMVNFDEGEDWLLDIDTLTWRKSD
jgi:hypothetical protein